MADKVKQLLAKSIQLVDQKVKAAEIWKIRKRSGNFSRSFIFLAPLKLPA